MGALNRLLLLAFLLMLASGCAKKTLVALAPDPDGRTGRIIVGNDAGTVTIDSPHQATTISDMRARPAIPVNLGQETLHKLFAEALSIQPKRPLHFLLYFEKETVLTADSQKLLPEIITAIRDRNSMDISVVGHTDTVGSKEFNLQLSNNRAAVVKDHLVRQGAEPAVIRTTSHGKENPLIPTEDNVNEPRNRRVEVVIR
jgi:outer membrane protein OmpA-like peptidoglycan-associated protein